MLRRVKKGSSVLVILALLFMVMLIPKQTVKATPPGFWIDPGNYTYYWYNSYTGCDYLGNTGTASDPYEIYTEQDLAGLSYYSNVSTAMGGTNFSGKYIQIMVPDLDLGAYEWTPIGRDRLFYGNVMGNDVTIRNVFIGGLGQSQNYSVMGFFGSMYGSAVQIHLSGIRYSTETSKYVGGFAARAGGWIKDCHVQGDIKTANAPLYVLGGFIGDGNRMRHVGISDADVHIYAENIREYTYLGGFAARCKGEFYRCSTSNTIEVLRSQFNCVAGLLGDGYNEITITECNCSRDMMVMNDSYVENLGGCIGKGALTVRETYSYGTINCMDSCMGMVGGMVSNDTCGSNYNFCGTENTIHTSNTICKIVGGFVGYGVNATHANCKVGTRIEMERGYFTGGYGGRVETSRMNQCYSHPRIHIDASVDSSLSACTGGFIGSGISNIVEKCLATGGIEVSDLFHVGGFYGWVENGYTATCYSITKIAAENECNVGGFAGYYDGEEIGGCYCTGDIAAASSSFLGGAIGFGTGNDRTNGLVWNKDSLQIVDGIPRPAGYNIDIGNGMYYPGVIGMSDSDMQSYVLVNFLNSLGYYSGWNISSYGGYPYF
ncbi:hypothetical protein [Anaeromicropila populeti]|uniref:The GLUG motif-containing protein n=1 Tax=Anaeromicropila populeti TaxID=37658 RepID=A0A1I6KQ34_9FIRM|nr:hypothetical protein [Anaeromicropila populeti]SFR93291.1 hypothetical protein SAMN05661086_02562 [Anaeromicropila populeti]